MMNNITSNISSKLTQSISHMKMVTKKSADNIKPRKKIQTISDEEAGKLREKYPNRIPVVVNTTGDLVINRSKYLVPDDLTLGEFIIVLRKRINIKACEAIYMFINGKIYPSNMHLKTICGENNFISISVAKESTFG
jgi:GABA(A) receptor-associated protein